MPPEYIIGPQDVLGIEFWRDPDMTGDVTVRPDGRITLPLIGDLTAAGMSPDALKAMILKAAAKVLKDPNVTVVIRQINSRKVFITGQVTTPGAHVLAGPLTVMQLISMAGGLTEYAKKKDITIMRTENGQQKVFLFNYNDVAKGKNLATEHRAEAGRHGGGAVAMRALILVRPDRLSAFVWQCADRPAPGTPDSWPFRGRSPARSQSRPARPVVTAGVLGGYDEYLSPSGVTGAAIAERDAQSGWTTGVETALNYFYGRPARFFSVDGRAVFRCL